MTRKQLLMAAGAAVVICAAASVAGYRYMTSPLRVANQTLAAMAADYSKVQAVAYTGMVDLDAADVIEMDGGACFFRVTDPDVQTMAEFEALLSRVYTQSKAEEVLSYCTETSGVLTEKEGALYRMDGYEMGWPLEQKASGAQREGDTITADITLAYNEPTPGTLVLQKEAGSWKIADLSL